MTRTGLATLACAASLLTTAAPVSAQVLGVFTWQMQPFCNKVALTLTIVPTGYMLHGYDDQCGADARASAVGTAVVNPNGTVGLHFTVLRQGATHVEVSGVVSPANGQGTWSDSVGNSGTLALGGAMPGLPPRPAMARIRTLTENPRQNTDACAGDAPPMLLLCGTATSYWRDGAYGVSGVQVWRDGAGQVHIRGAVERSSGTIGGALFFLPEELRPKRLLAIPVLAGQYAGSYASGTAMLVIYPSGFQASSGAVAIYNASGSYTTVHFGELVFSVEQ
jgi:hypothetical protein